MDAYLRDRIENIADDDFWSSFRPSRDIRPALAAAKKGERDEAYVLLGGYHGRTLAMEAGLLREQLMSYPVGSRAATSLREQADKVVRHEIQGWHNQTIRFGRKIDFNADFGCSGQYGFHYLGWLVPVLQQYALTGEEKYRACFLDVLEQYYEQRNKLKWRIPHLHPVYYELGAHAKIGVFLPAYAVLAGDGPLTTGQREAFLKLLLGMARSLYRLQEGGYRRGNWQIVGAMNLFQMGCAFPELKEAARWRRRGLEITMAHVKDDFFTDGGHSERCWGYGWMSLSGILETYRVGLRYGQLAEARRPLERLLRKGFQWYAATVSPTLEQLNYGDGGICSAEGIFAEARKTFPKMAREPGLLGVDRSKSRILPASGYAFMVGGAEREAPFMTINFGGWGGWHTHRDLLDFTLWCYGEPIIEEVGRFGSYDNPLEPFFRSEQAHNQIVLEHVTMNRQAHQGQNVAWHSDDRADFFSAYHLAYESPRAKVQRQIVFVKPDYWVILDTVDATEKIFQVSSYLHAPRPFRVLRHGVAHVRGRRSCLVAFADPASIRRFGTGVDYSRAEFAGPIGRDSQRHRLVATTWRDVGDPRPVTFAMLLVPFPGATPPEVSIRPLEIPMTPGSGARAFAVTFRKRTDVVVFHPGAGDGLRVAGRRIEGVMAARIRGEWVECPSRRERQCDRLMRP